jgi:hypothetical protein
MEKVGTYQTGAGICYKIVDWRLDYCSSDIPRRLAAAQGHGKRRELFEVTQELWLAVKVSWRK